jgi:L-amino acid N-acyltransferase YncA
MVLGHVGQVLNKQKPKLPILAHIKPGNQGSVRAFEKAGFVLRGASPEGLLQLEYRPVVAVLDNGKGAVH